MGLIDRFQALFRRGTPAPTSTATTLVQPPPRPSALARLLSEETDRRSVVLECAAMYKADPRARRIIGTMATDATRGGFTLTVTGPRAAEAKAIADALWERINVWQAIEDWVRLSLRDGDSFLELVADAGGEIAAVSRKPTLEMHRLSNEFDEFVDPTRAYAWSDTLWGGWIPGQMLPPGAVTFAEWQVIHARYEHDSDGRYGWPLFGSARSQFKRMKEGELDIAIRRKTRAGMKYIHSLKDASEADIEAYRARNQAALNDPFNAVADFFSSRDTTITAIEGDVTLSDIADVLHHVATWWMASPLPMALVGYGENLNRDVLEEQKVQYDVAKEELSGWVVEQILEPLVMRQWLLLGIWPDNLEWEFVWTAKQALDAVSLGELAKAITTLKAGSVLSEETLLRIVARFLPDFDPDAELQALAAERPDEIDRMAQLAGAMDDTTDNNDLGDDDAGDAADTDNQA